MAKRPTPHVDNTAAQADTSFTPTFTPATAATKHVKVCMYGDNGTGKTRASGTFPKPVVLALDPGFTVLKQLPDADDIMVARIPDPARGDRATLLQLWDYITWLQAGEHDRQTVVLDSVTELHKLILAAVMRKPRQRESPTIPSTDDYVEANEKLTTVLRHLRDLPMHVVYTAHHKVLKKKDDIIGVRPDLSEKLSTALGGMCDVVLRTGVVEREDEQRGRVLDYVGQTVPINGVQAKDRSGNLRTPYVLLGFDKIAEAYGLEAEDEPAPAPKAKAKAQPKPKETKPAAPQEQPAAAPAEQPTAAPAEAPAATLQVDASEHHEPEPCSTCSGTGERVTDDGTTPCEDCHGRGEL